MVGLLAVVGGSAAAREIVVQGGTVVRSGGVVVQAQPTAPPAQPANQPQNNAGGKKEGGKKDDKAKDGEKKNEESKDQAAAGGPVKRPEKPPRVPDPREFDVEPVGGRVQFSFHGQPWPDVMQWLANISDQSLDWQELPGGYLNLTTQRGYTLPEARDLINGRLQARGYALLLKGEVLSVVKLEAVDPSMIPRVTEDQLYDRQPNDIVKLTFQMPPEIEPKQAIEDVKQALSKNAKVFALTATKRLLVIDTVANLRMVSALLNEERVEQEGKEVPVRFVLRYARAEKVINTLYVVLGLDPAAQPSQMELQIQQQKMQLLMQMQQRGKDVARMLKADGPKVYLAFNRHENSILVNAPERELKIIKRTIAFLDIPARGSAAAASTTDQADTARFAKTYDLEAIDPQGLILTLEEIGDLDPLTELRADNKAKILFVRGSESDHGKVKALIEQLDKSGEAFEVFWLRRNIPADAVAGTIQALLGEEEEEEDNSYRRYYYYYGQPDKEEEKPPLRVRADTDNNRLLVRGAEETIEQVRRLLDKMGALAEEPVANQQMMVTDPIDPEETERLLERLQRLWPSIGGGTELIIEPAEPKANEPEPTPAPSAATDDSQEPRVVSTNSSRFRLLANKDSDAAPGSPTVDGAESAESDASSRPKVSIAVTPDGRLMLNANDARALAQLRQVIETLTPRPDLFKEFPVEHASALYIHWKLEDYFEEEIKGEQGEMMRDWWGSWQRTNPADKGVSLSNRRRLRLIYNKQTNSIIAAHASAEQLRTIGRLIETWDQPPRDDDIKNRRTGLVKLRYSRAKVVEAALKGVYRDLLSSRDKEFDTDEEKGSGFTLPSTTEIEFSGAHSDEIVSRTKPIRVGFDGALSIGVDELANMLVISAERELFDSVVAMARALDEEARPQTTVQVLRTGVSAGALRQALSESMGVPWTGGRPEQGNQPQANAENQQQENGRRDRGRDSRRGRRRN